MSFSIHKRKRVSIDCQDYDEYEEYDKHGQGITGTGIGEPILLTEQHHKDSMSVQSIIRNAQKGVLSAHIKQYDGKYMDLPGEIDFLEAQNTIARAQEMWSTVPSNIRKHFDNDPGKYVDFMVNADNYDEIKKMGLDPSYIPEELRPKKEEIQPPIKQPVKPVKEENE